MKIVRGILEVVAFWTFFWLICMHIEWVFIGLVVVLAVGLSSMIFMTAAGW